jgi:hypothetical protein
MVSRPKNLMYQVRDAIRLKHYARNTEQAYVYWIKKYILFHNKRHPNEMDTGEVHAFLTHLALEEHISLLHRTKRVANWFSCTVMFEASPCCSHCVHREFYNHLIRSGTQRFYPLYSIHLVVKIPQKRLKNGKNLHIFYCFYLLQDELLTITHDKKSIS